MAVIHSLLIALLVAMPLISAHIPEVLPDADWETRHMIEEHHISDFDAASFFLLHDYDSTGTWTPEEVRKTYGLDDESNSNLTEDRKKQILTEVFAIFDPKRTGVITKEEWLRLSKEGKKLPDFGVGPGHHGDMEYEYEIHHFEKYHGENARPEDLTHPEDIEHFRRHDEEEHAQNKLDQLQMMSIVEANIPEKFKRSTS
ncbi:conserved fungal protein [Coccidioides immitis H538.4]|uniref:Conserved fungal protein n=1 Tax=Coccidioides immitis H538.4 TaxID=396776 RepID=A0A0J8RUZ9_COCIT|nr:conserved fungal protein [Coccidioides immitis H538.4]